MKKGPFICLNIIFANKYRLMQQIKATATLNFNFLPIWTIGLLFRIGSTKFMSSTWSTWLATCPLLYIWGRHCKSFSFVKKLYKILNKLRAKRTPILSEPYRHLLKQWYRHQISRLSSSVHNCDNLPHGI